MSQTIGERLYREAQFALFFRERRELMDELWPRLSDLERLPIDGRLTVMANAIVDEVWNRRIAQNPRFTQPRPDVNIDPQTGAVSLTLPDVDFPNPYR